jgi:hypothetical protein
MIPIIALVAVVAWFIAAQVTATPATLRAADPEPTSVSLGWYDADGGWDGLD